MNHPIGMVGTSLLGVFTLLVVPVPWSSGAFRFLPHKVVYDVTRRASDVCVGHSMGEFVMNADDCSKFYYCLDNGEGAEAECPKGMLFNNQSKLCDQESNVVCQTNGHHPDHSNTGQNIHNNTNTNTNINNNEVASVERYCAGQALQQNGRIEYVRSSRSCRHYYICYYGQAILQECSLNLHWNANTKKCDFPSASGCSISSNGASQNGGSTDVGNLIQCPPFGEHIYPHMRRCDFFVYCVKGHAVLQQCPFYNEFDIDTKTCKSRNMARCVTDLLR